LIVRGIVSLARLSRNQWRRPADLERRQFQALEALVRHAYAAVPFYRELYDRWGVSPETLKAPDDLRRFPIVTRQDLQATPRDQLVSHGADPDRCLRSRTSGSTGVPLEILFEGADRAAMNPSFLRAYMSWGLRPWHRVATLQARPERLGRRSWYQHLGIFRTQVLSSREEPAQWIESLREWRPTMLHGYSLTLKLLAEALERAPSGTLRIPLVTSTSGVLDDDARDRLSATLGARVADIYASDEAGSVIAWECPRCAGYHLSSDTVLTEFLAGEQPARPGEDAAVVITNLTSRTMPFVRYDQGDVARVSDRLPVCGRGLPLMDSVRGRAGDFILLRSGRKLTPHPFFLVLDHAAGVGRWQIVQEAVDRISVAATMPGGRNDNTIGFIRRSIAELVGDGVAIDVHVVETLQESGRSKLRSVISKLPESHTPGGRDPRPS
jgi:phenylacetate-CoA ligase